MAASQLFAQSGTAASVTAIGGVGVVGGSLVSTADNAFRALVADLVNNVVTRGSDIASATTLDLDAASTPSLIHNITGTTTTTAITLTTGQWRVVRAVGVWPLTAGASLIINGSTTVSYTCAAEDVLLISGFAAGVVRVTKIGGKVLGGDSTTATTILFGGGATGVTYDAAGQTLTWRQRDQTVTFKAYVKLTNKGGGASTGVVTVRCSGLPVAVGYWVFPVVYRSVTGIVGTVLAEIVTATGDFSLFNGSSTGVASLTDANCGNSSEFEISGSYQTT